MENLPQLKKERAQCRRVFTKASKELDSLLKENPVKKDEVIVSLRQLEDKGERLFASDGKLREVLLVAKVGDEEIEQEYDSEEIYRDELVKYKIKCESVFNTVVTQGKTVRLTSSTAGNEEVGEAKRKFRLPMLELQKFDGDVRNWIGFWGQFKKIDQDDEIDKEDKFQYLIQATEPRSAARKLVEGFPPSGENYAKAISQLKNRFAKDEFLIEVYVRELLDLVLQQSIKNKAGMSLSNLFDKLETQLRALETLGVTSDKYAAMLYPLVESALPAEILKAWERHRSLRKTEGESSDKDSTNRLNLLLDFLRSEVESEERINLVRTSFSAGKDGDRNAGYKVREQQHGDFEMSTAATIFTSNQNEGKKSNSLCIFCEKAHSSQDCIKAQNLTFDEKRNILTKKNCCFGCLRPNHNIKKCRRFIKCLVCGKKHFPIMCPDLHATKLSEHKNSGNTSKEANLENVLTSNVYTETLLQTIIVLLIHNNKTRKVRALLDSGSQKSYILSDCVRKMNFNKVGEESVIQGVFGGMESSPCVHNLYDVCIQSLDHTFKINLIMLDQRRICTYVPRLQNRNCIEYLKRKNIILSDIGSNVPEIELLLGADIIGNLFTGTIEKIDERLVAMETHLGWTVFGQCSNKINSFVTLSCSSQHSISDLWNLDILGIMDPSEVKSKEDQQAIVVRYFTETISINQSHRYEVCLPWKENRPQLFSNLEIAENRLLAVSKKLINLKKFEDYENVFNEWLKLGIIEEVPTHEWQNPSHYLPHHAVFKDSSLTTKIRPVFDASAKDRKGHSLNDSLEKGPNLIEQIPSILLQFRMHSIGVTADIAKAFLQISLTPNDRDYLRFLWWDDYSKQKMKLFRHCRVVFGVSSSPFLLAATINYHLNNAPSQLTEMASKLKTSFYVDNCVTSVKSQQELETFIRESKYLMSTAQFELRGWIHSLMVPNSDTNGVNVVPVLGLSWNFQEDTLFCDLNSITQLDDVSFTKRGLLSIAQKLFDPIGFTCPVTVIPKLLLRETWNLKIGWDKELPKEIEKQYKAWLKDISWVSLCQIPRTMSKFSREDSDFTLHVFCDASKTAYATCIFIRAENKGETSLQLLQAKSRIAPSKPITLPRLELLAALIGIRLCQSIKKVEFFSKLKTYYWSDSMVVLAWIKSDGIWNVFVGNRIKEILSFSNRDDWHHVPGTLNPADLPSRGCTGKYLHKSKWWLGPSWLYRAPKFWPNTDIITNGADIEHERKKNIISIIACESNTTKEFNYFSRYRKIVRMIGWIFRFYFNSKTKNNKLVGEMTYTEFHEAENHLLKIVQMESFGHTRTASIKNMQVFKDDKGLLRVKTKLILRNDNEDFKYPILLPSDHEIVFKLVSEQHLLSCHAGVQTLLGLLRERFWILRGRKTVRKILMKCVICRRHSQKAIETPFAPLPENRIKDAAAFEVSGIDFAGPLYLKGGEKAWIVLFTCAVYRAVHLELVTSLSTEAFIKALRRFIARRGRVSIIYSDNGTNFIGTYNYLKVINWNEILRYSTVNRIKWIFNPPTAAWWGGWWERVVRIVKDLIRRNLGKSCVNYEELMTILCDCEAVINARPLTYVPSEEELLPLTPAHFIQNIANNEVPDLDTIDRTFLLRRHRYLQGIRDNLRQRFRKEYLAELVHSGQRKVSQVKVGDVVLLGSDKSKRVNWPIAKVLEIYPGRDKIPRVARIKTGGGIELIRPFQRLYPLEISATDAQEELKISTSADSDNQSNSAQIEPRITQKHTRQQDKPEKDLPKNEDSKTRYGRIVKRPERFQF